MKKYILILLFTGISYSQTMWNNSLIAYTPLDSGMWVYSGVLATNPIIHHSIIFSNKESQELTMTFKDSLVIESDMPISEGAELFLKFVGIKYTCTVNMLREEIMDLQKENEKLRASLDKIKTIVK